MNLEGQKFDQWDGSSGAPWPFESSEKMKIAITIIFARFLVMPSALTSVWAN